jgi:hypothetical protein
LMLLALAMALVLFLARSKAALAVAADRNDRVPKVKKSEAFGRRGGRSAPLQSESPRL